MTTFGPRRGRSRGSTALVVGARRMRLSASPFRVPQQADGVRRLSCRGSRFSGHPCARAVFASTPSLAPVAPTLFSPNRRGFVANHPNPKDCETCERVNPAPLTSRAAEKSVFDELCASTRYGCTPAIQASSSCVNSGVTVITPSTSGNTDITWCGPIASMRVSAFNRSQVPADSACIEVAMVLLPLLEPPFMRRTCQGHGSGIQSASSIEVLTVPHSRRAVRSSRLSVCAQ